MEEVKPMPIEKFEVEFGDMLQLPAISAGLAQSIWMEQSRFFLVSRTLLL